MIGFLSPTSITSDICSKILSFWTTLSEVHSSKLSAQSPPCSRNASPLCAFASCDFKFSTSQVVTIGGRLLSCASALSRCARSRYTGCWAACRLCQLAGCQSVGTCAWVMAYDVPAPMRHAGTIPPAPTGGQRNSVDRLETALRLCRAAGLWCASRSADAFRRRPALPSARHVCRARRRDRGDTLRRAVAPFPAGIHGRVRRIADAARVPAGDSEHCGTRLALRRHRAVARRVLVAHVRHGWLARPCDHRRRVVVAAGTACGDATRSRRAARRAPVACRRRADDAAPHARGAACDTIDRDIFW